MSGILFLKLRYFVQKLGGYGHGYAKLHQNYCWEYCAIVQKISSIAPKSLYVKKSKTTRINRRALNRVLHKNKQVQIMNN